MRRCLAIAVAAALATPAVAPGASRPSATTGGVSDVTLTGATLRGTVDPQGSPTTYRFQYGTSRSYGSTTGPASAGNGTRNVTASAPVTGLRPGTTYHFRIVASNALGIAYGGDRTFTTRSQPLGFSVFAAPNPAPYGAATTVQGQLTGTGSTSRSVVLQEQAFPYTAGWANVGNAQVTDAAGRFSFAVLSLTENTQFRVATADRKATSAVVLVGSRVLVHLRVAAHRVRSHALLRFAGTVEPQQDGARYAVQRRRGGVWVTIAGSTLRPLTAAKSRFARRVPIVHSGLYRVYVGAAGGAHVPGASAEERLRVVRR